MGERQFPFLSDPTDFGSRLNKALSGSNASSQSDKGNYQAQYPAIKKWFSATENWDSDRVYQGSLMVYGWMPGILEGRKKTDDCLNPQSASKIANLLNAGPQSAEKDELWSFVNKSFVGTSKFLHFWKPGQFAIWDSHVARALSTGRVTREKDIENLEVVKNYQKLMREKANCDPDEMRANEYALFRYGQNLGKGDRSTK